MLIYSREAADMSNMLYLCSKSDYDKYLKTLKNDKKYIVDNKKLKSFCYRHVTVNYILKRKCKKNHLSYFNIINMLDLEEEVDNRLNRAWAATGTWKWIFSVAIGISRMYKEFVMPWMSISMLEVQCVRNRAIIDAVKEINGSIMFFVEHEDFENDMMPVNVIKGNNGEVSHAVEYKNLKNNDLLSLFREEDFLIKAM